MENISILCCSCDKYSDIWDPMFGMFYKYWPDCPYNVYLMTNKKVFNNSRVKTITTGEDKTWSIEFRQALESIDCDYVFIIMEDYLLKSKVDFNEFEMAVQYMKREKIDCLRTYPCPEPNKPYGQMGKYKVGLVNADAPYRISLQAAIWRKDYVISIINDNDSAWQFEYLGTHRSSIDDSKIVSVYKNNKKLIFDYYCTGIIQGYWIKEAVELCEKENIHVDLTKRKIEPRGIRFKRIVSDKYLGGIKKIVKKTPIYYSYRKLKYN